ncbi:MAG: SusC/RagA family TonB-linked outer membrane protein [Bacteroidota bacterium]
MKITDRKAVRLKRRSAQTWLAMKLTAFFLTALLLQVSARTLSQTVTYKAKEVSLKQAFAEIKKQTGYLFFYKDQYLEKAKAVSPDFQNTQLQSALEQLLKDQPLNFSIQGNTVFITLKTVAFPNETTEASPLPPLPTDISGTVTDENGSPLSGAAITIKATGRGTTTDAQGRFLLKGIDEKSVIIIAFVGYTKQEITIGKQTFVNVKLKVATNELDKVVIQAYGQTTSRFNTGNIATVSSEEIERQPVMNALEALQGKIPGVVIGQTSGYESAPFKVEIRGRNGINPNLPSEPLYIVDGVPLTVLNFTGNYASGSYGFTQSGLPGPANGQSPFFSINPSDIESISVLVDADATAIYGSRGANGVILITTKKGKIGKTKLEANVYHGFSKVTQRYDLLNTQQYLSMRREAFKNDGIVPTVSNAYDLLVWDTTKYTDWQKIIWGGTGKRTDVELSLSGGDKAVNFRLSGAYERVNPILSNGADQRASVQFNLSHKSLNQRFTISFTNLYSYTQSDLIYLPGQIALPPNSPAIFDASGNLNFAGWLPASSQLNSFSNLLQPYTSKTGFLNGRLALQYEILKGLNISTNLGYSTTNVSQIRIIPISSLDPSSNPKGSSQFGNNKITNSIIEPQIEYKTLLLRGKLNFLVGGTLQELSQDGNFIQGMGYVNDNLLRSISNAGTKLASDVSGQYKYAAIFSRITYNLDNKYILNLTARRDGSSRFGEGKQFGNFGAIGAAWIFTEEKWVKNNFSFLSFGKLRGSYGVTGRDQIGDYGYLTRWSASTTIPYQTTPAYVPLQHANPDLQWEENRKLEVALNLGLLNDKISLELNWYRNICGNQLLPLVLPSLTGFIQVNANSPATVQNTGIEGKINAKVIDGKNLQWQLNFNIGFNRNKLLAFPDLSQSSYASFFVIGESLNLARLLHYTGVDPQTGQYQFSDKNHDGAITNSYNNGINDLYNNDLSVKFQGGFGSDLTFKNWQLNLFFNFLQQPFKQSAVYNGIPGQVFSNQSSQVLDHWQKPGDIAKFARYTTASLATDQYFSNYSDGPYSNGSYIRLKNLSVSYDLSSAWIKKIGMQNCKLYLRGENLFIITKYNGVDPASPGLNLLPPQKILTAGIQLNL